MKRMITFIAFLINLSCLVAKSCATLATPWTVACQAPLSKGFSRQEYRSGLPFPSAGDIPDQGIEWGLLHCRQIFLPTALQGKPHNSNQLVFIVPVNVEDIK